MGGTVSYTLGYAPDDEFDPRIDDFISKDRNYTHFDLPLKELERNNFKVSADEICQNSFWPLIGYVVSERRAKKDENDKLIFTTKDRPIKFGSHRDAAIFEYCAKSLSKDYEAFLQSTAINDSVLAYRSGVGNNINHSKALFDEIKIRGNCFAIAMDIKGFFDNISHDILYSQILRIRKVPKLNRTDFKIFQRMTKFEWVNSDQMKKHLGRRYGANGRICTAVEFRSIVRGKNSNLVVQNTNTFGIPQGTPLSGLYANVSLIEFDERVSGAVQKLGGSYRRYSDDIAILIPDEITPSTVIDIVTAELSIIGLLLSVTKTDVSHFQNNGGTQESDSLFQYLGFTFDGKFTRIRQSSLNRYYAKMNRGVRAKVHAAKDKNIPPSEIYMRELFRKYTHFGKSRNFPRYAFRAAAVHDAPEIRQQLKRHMAIFKLMVKNAIDKIY